MSPDRGVWLGGVIDSLANQAAAFPRISRSIRPTSMRTAGRFSVAHRTWTSSDSSSPEQEDAVRRALELFSGSLRALGREAGVSYRLLGMIRDGQRTATRATVEALAEAFERLRDRHDEAARVLRESLNEEEA